MSYTEYHIGKIKPINITGEELENYCKQILLEHSYISENSPEKDEFYNSYAELLVDELGDEYMYLNGILYKIIEDKEVDDDVVNITRNEDGTINYVATFYNGGTCLTEVLESVLKKEINGL